MTSTNILTVTARNGQVVLAKMHKGNLFPKTFTNRTQAEKAANAAGGYVLAKWPFLVVVPQEVEWTPESARRRVGGTFGT